MVQRKKENHRNPWMTRKGIAHRPSHRKSYYTAHINVVVSPAVKEGMIAIAENEGRDISWVVNEVFRFYFGLKDDTPYQGVQGQRRQHKLTKLRLVK